MNLDELQSVQARERQSSDLQHLRASFYAEVGEYIRELDEERARALERADDPFSSPEVRRLTDDIETAEATVEAIYERRVGKVVKKASIAAADMPVDADGLTQEEEVLFGDLVDRIERNRETVLSVLEGEGPSVSVLHGEAQGAASGHAGTDGPGETDGDSSTEAASGRADGTPGHEEQVRDRDQGAVRDRDQGEVRDRDRGEVQDPDQDRERDVEPVPPDEPPGDAGPRADANPPDDATAVGGADETTAPRDRVDAADLMGGGATEGPTASTGAPESGDVDHVGDDPLAAGEVPGTADASTATGERQETEGSNVADAPVSGQDATDATADPSRSDRGGGGVDRTTVRITADVGEVVGADDRDYHLGSEDVVTLPAPNAEVLVAKDAAERLD